MDWPAMASSRRLVSAVAFDKASSAVHPGRREGMDALRPDTEDDDKTAEGLVGTSCPMEETEAAPGAGGAIAAAVAAVAAARWPCK